MFDDLHRGPDEGPKRPGHRPNGDRPVADREVPLVRQSGAFSATMHQWLDGELPEAAARRADSGSDVEFWRRMNGELAERRHMRTPAYLEAQIMSALPDRAPGVITPWWRREMVLSPVAIVGGAAALVALTAVATAVLTRF